MNRRVNQINETLLRVVNKIVRAEKTPGYFGGDVLLHPSEIHMIMFIGNNEGVHLSELSRIVGVTRGAVSQAVAKLENKELVEKIEAPHNGLKTLPVLTHKGRAAYRAHERHHEALDAELLDFIEELTHEAVAVIEDFLRHPEKMADQHR